MTDPLRERTIAAVGDQYELENEIGRGGISVVYRARDLRLKRRVAIKVLPPELAHDTAIRSRFTREAQTAAQLSHAHIVPIYDVGDREGIAYFVMAVITGGNLARLLAHEPLQPVDEVRRVLAEVADALAYAHLRGVVHRDIKPDNILLDGESGRAMVTDFGIARAMEAGSRLTMTGIAVGTPAYMSPEQAVGEREVDGRSDIYSLGVVGYQMLTGRAPFTAGNSMALLLKHVSDRPRPIAELRPDTPKALREVVERALMKSAEDRWPTADAMRDALLADGAATPTWRAERREPVRYSTPRSESTRSESTRSESARSEPRPTSPRRGVPVPEVRTPPQPVRRAPNEIVMEQAHLASLTPVQREDLRLWHGRVNLMDRIKAVRWYGLLTVATWGAAFGVLGASIAEGIPPGVLAPLVPLYMSQKLWRRGRSLKQAGVRLRRVFMMPRLKWVLPAPPPQPTEAQIAKLAPRDVLEGPQGRAIRRAAEERQAILGIIASLPKSDRALLPELAPTVNALVERVANLAQTVHRLDQSMDPRIGEELEARIAMAASEGETPEGQRRLSLLERQRDTLRDISQRRAALTRQLDTAGLALVNLRLDLIKVRSSGLQSALSTVSSATQDARALSREIDVMLDATAEAKGL